MHTSIGSGVQTDAPTMTMMATQPPNDAAAAEHGAHSSESAEASANELLSSLSSSMSALSLPPSPPLVLSPLPSPPRTLHLFLDLDGCLVLDSSCDWTAPPHPRPFLGLFLDVAFRCCASVSLWTAAGDEWLKRVHAMMQSRGLLPPGASFLLQWSGSRCRQRANLAAIEAGDFYARRLPSKPLLKAWRRGAGRAAGMRRHNTLIVDDTPSTYRDNYGNAVPIASFVNGHQEAEDDELRRLAAFLPVLAQLPDVRAKEKRGWSHRYAHQNDQD